MGDIHFVGWAPFYQQIPFLELYKFVDTLSFITEDKYIFIVT